MTVLDEAVRALPAGPCGLAGRARVAELRDCLLEIAADRLDEPEFRQGAALLAVLADDGPLDAVGGVTLPAGPTDGSPGNRLRWLAIRLAHAGAAGREPRAREAADVITALTPVIEGALA